MINQEEFDFQVEIATPLRDGSRLIADVYNQRTGESVQIAARDYIGLEKKALAQSHRWAREWMLEKTQEALSDIDCNRTLLKTGIRSDQLLKWDALMRLDEFPESKPKLEDYQKNSLAKSLRFLPFLTEKAQNEEKKEQDNYKQALDAYHTKCADWQRERDKYNKFIKKCQRYYELGKPRGIEFYIKKALNQIKYPKNITINSDVIYNEMSKVALVELQLPSKQSISKIKEYRYIATSQSVKRIEMSDKDYSAYYNDVIYQIILRSLNVVFMNDYKRHIETVVLNGNTDLRDLSRGKVDNKTIATVSVERQAFVDITLAEVDAEACFKGLKGIAAGNLALFTPVKPILQFNKRDRRIIQADEVIDRMSVQRNLATIPWMEFEILIRDLMRREFSGDGVSVNVTRASRDAGVDAIVFDEDPIYGGKFIIQAKRYNNLVPVSAVRDLFGAVHNEGAVKGILVTTSYFGPDSIAFAKDKPLTLINGDQLLFMLNKHGYDFKIKLRNKLNKL